MAPGARSHESASLVVAYCTAVPEHMQSGIRELISVFTPEADRRKGYATALLKAVCEEADDAQKVLMLTAADPSLVGFYRRFGFVELPNPVPLMARQPRPSLGALRALQRKLLGASISKALH